MSYKQELREYIIEMHQQANDVNIDADKRLHLIRIAEIIDFIVNHTDDAIAELKRDD